MKNDSFILLIALVSIILIGTEGAAVYTSRSEFCISCHPMQEQYDRWQHSSHREWAGCSDCHVPHDNVLNKYYRKGTDGFKHIYHYTFSDELDNIRISELSAEVVKENCLRCHTDLMAGISIEGRNCWECHRGLPHGFRN